MKLKFVTCWIMSAERNALRAYSHDQGRRMADVLSEIVREYFVMIGYQPPWPLDDPSSLKPPPEHTYDIADRKE